MAACVCRRWRRAADTGGGLTPFVLSTVLVCSIPGLKDVYSAPTLKFRINRKSVGIDFDEYEDVNVSVCFFCSTSGFWVDGARGWDRCSDFDPS